MSPGEGGALCAVSLHCSFSAGGYVPRVGEFWITAFVIVCLLVIVVVPVKALSRGIRDYRQDRRLREMPTPTPMTSGLRRSGIRGWRSRDTAELITVSCDCWNGWTWAGRNAPRRRICGRRCWREMRVRRPML